MRACVDPRQLSLLLRTVPSGRSQSVVGRQLRHSGHRSRGQSGRRFRRPWLSRSAVFPRIRKNSKKGAGQCLSRWYNALAFGVGEVLHRQASGPALVAHGPDARIAQLVEQRIENPRVGGSNPPPGTTSSSRLYPAKTCHLAPLRWVLVPGCAILGGGTQYPDHRSLSVPCTPMVQLHSSLFAVKSCTFFPGRFRPPGAAQCRRIVSLPTLWLSVWSHSKLY
jgi:hypothetical protein